MFEDHVCVDLSGVLDGRPNYANITFSGPFAGPCADQPKVIDKGLDYATDLLSGFYARARCPSYASTLWRGSGQGVQLRKGEPSSKASLDSLQAKRL